MLRTIAISLILLLSVGVMLPFANSAHGIRQSTQITQKKSKRYRSRAWWRRYRARLRAKREALELARRNALMAIPQNIAMGDLSAVSGPASPSITANGSTMTFNELPPVGMRTPATVETDATVAQTTTTSLRPTASKFNVPVPVAQAAVTQAPVVEAPVAQTSVAQGTTMIAPPPAPATLSAHAAVNATRPRVVNAARPVVAAESATKLPGQMNLSVVALSRPNPIFLTQREQKKMLAGVPVADLKRIVIDKMVSNGGWVVNDFVRDVNGNRVFVVTGRTPKDALTPEKAWTFYFTEAGGRVYGLTTEAPVEYAESMSNEAERFIQSLRAKSAGTKE
jgi:hypothetical protein